MIYVGNRGGNISSSNCVSYQCLGPDITNVATYFALGRRCHVRWCGETVRQTADMLPENVTCGCNETVASSSISISASSARASRPAPCHVSRTISSAHVATCVTLHVIIFLQNYGEHAGLVTRSRGNVTLHGRVSYIAVPGLLVMSFVHLSTYLNHYQLFPHFSSAFIPL